MKTFINFAIHIANKPKQLFGAFAAFILFSSVQYAYVEGRSILDGLWWTIVTACTVGYGDQYPATAGGKVLASVIMLTAIFLIAPVVIAQLASQLIVDRDKWSHEEQEDLKAAFKRIPELVALLEDVKEQLKLIYDEVDDVEEMASRASRITQNLEDLELLEPE